MTFISSLYFRSQYRLLQAGKNKNNNCGLCGGIGQACYKRRWDWSSVCRSGCGLSEFCQKVVDQNFIMNGWNRSSIFHRTEQN